MDKKEIMDILQKVFNEAEERHKKASKRWGELIGKDLTMSEEVEKTFSRDETYETLGMQKAITMIMFEINKEKGNE